MKRNIIIATTAVAALIAGGTATAVAVNGDDEPGGAQTSAQLAAQDQSSIRVQDDDRDDNDRDGGLEDLREARAAKVSAPDAAAAALKAVPGTVTELDLDEDRPGLVWDVDVLGQDNKWHDITLDAGNARVLNHHIDHEDDDEHGQGYVRDQLKGAKTDAAGAARTAAAAHGTVTAVDLDDDYGPKAVWEVETVTEDGTEHTVLVDPQSGKLTAAPAQDDGDDGDD
ncbi:PepSY domain-containing protein [Streptomyces halobius]|uniref:PepSY domain-containing protein n=1 Tax=Streptomyces halobius TaxID=2879846 RepID=A0ABY4M5T5_9ACTN|nr:PepSY domain-containing protein [Streptomyces halobius]UQA93053.1 PepSY domain-containing protein [Streptomyces halobius]